MKQLKITLKKSTIGCLSKQIKTVEALGLKKIGQTVFQPDNSCTRGMVFRVKHMVVCEEIEQ